MDKRLVVVATTEEEALARKKFPNNRVLKTGVGAVNVIEALQGLNRNVPILNYGYAGSNVLPIGTEVEVGECSLYHPKASFCSKAYILPYGNTPCLTSSDFVTESESKEPRVYDMELVFIMALGFKDVRSIKVVSDNLSLKQYEENIKTEVK